MTTRIHHDERFRITPRRGYTLVELVASVAATSILVAGMGSVVMVAARSTSESTLPARQIEGGAAVHEILGDVEYAVSFNERSPSAVAFTVADRDADGVRETIRYEWSGTPGDPVTRQCNAGAVVDFVDDVHGFEYSDLVETVTSCDGTLTHHVYQCDVALQVGAEPSTRMLGAVMVHNAPEVAAP